MWRMTNVMRLYLLSRLKPETCYRWAMHRRARRTWAQQTGKKRKNKAKVRQVQKKLIKGRGEKLHSQKWSQVLPWRDTTRIWKQEEKQAALWSYRFNQLGWAVGESGGASDHPHGKTGKNAQKATESQHYSTNRGMTLQLWINEHSNVLHTGTLLNHKIQPTNPATTSKQTSRFSHIWKPARAKMLNIQRLKQKQQNSGRPIKGYKIWPRGGQLTISESASCEQKLRWWQGAPQLENPASKTKHWTNKNEKTIKWGV